MKFSKEIHKFVILPGLCFLLIICLFFLANTLIQKPEFQQYILKKVCIGYGLDVKTGKIELDIFGAPGVVVPDVETCLLDKSCSITTPGVKINFSTGRLLKGELIPVSVDVKHPVMKLSEADAMTFFSKKGKKRRTMPFFCRGGVNTLNIENGELIIDGPSGFKVSNLTFKLQRLKGTSETLKISGTGKVEYKGSIAEFSLSSTVDPNPDDVLKSVFSASLQTENTPLTWIPRFTDRIEIEKGLLNSDLNIYGHPDEGITLGGSLNFKSAAFTLRKKKRSKHYNITALNCNLNASIKNQAIHIDSLNMKNQDLDLDVDMLLDLTDLHNPYLKLTAKSKFMPIETFRIHFPFQIPKPWLKNKLFPLFESGMVRMDKFVLDGTIAQIKHLREMKNQSVIGMSFTCESFIVSNQGIQIPFTDISASVDIWDGNLKVSGLSAVFGDSKIYEGSLDVQGLVSGHPFFKVFVDGDFDIQELLSHREMYVIPEKARQQIEKYKEVQGRLSAKTFIGYQKDWKTPRLLSGDFYFTNTLWYKRPLDIPLQFNQIDFHFSEDGNNNFSGEGVFGNTSFDVSGLTELSGNKLTFTHADIKADTDMNQLIKGCYKSDKFPFEFKGYLPWDISVDKYEDTYRYTGRIGAEKIDMESDRFLIHASGDGNYVSFDLTQEGNDRLDMDRIEFRLGTSRLVLSGDYSLSSKNLNALKITTRDLSIGDFGIHFKGKENVLSGFLDANLNFSFLGKDLSGMQVTGNMKGKDISFIPGFLPLPVSEGAFNLDLSGKNGFVNQCDMKFGDHPLQLTGIMKGWDEVNADLLVTTDFIDLTEIILNNRSTSRDITSSHGKPLLKTGDINLKINASKGIWRKLEFDRLNADMVFSSKNIVIKNAQAELDTGDVSVSGNIARREQRKINISGEVNLDKQPFDKLLSDMGFGDKGVKGTLSLKASANLEGNTQDGLLKILSGNIDNLVMTKGQLKDSKVFLKILDLLNIPDKFRERPSEMKEEGFYFNSVEGTGKIEKGILETDGFVLKSPAINAVGSGKVNLYMQAYEIRLLVQPLTNIDFIVKHIPILGPIFSTDSETFFTVGYDVTGTFSQPKLDFAPEESFIGLLGVFKRALLRPYNIIENISSAAKSMKKIDPEETENNESLKTEQP